MSDGVILLYALTVAVGLGLQPNEVLLIVGETLGLLTGGRSGPVGRSALCTVCTPASGTAVQR